jgi:hypothetical protein
MAGFEERDWPVDVSEKLTDFTEFAPPPPTNLRPPRRVLASWNLTVRNQWQNLTFVNVSRIADTCDVGAQPCLPDVLGVTRLSAAFSVSTARGLAVLLPPSTAFTLVSVLSATISFPSAVRLHWSFIPRWSRCRNVRKLDLCSRMITVVEIVWRSPLNKLNKSGGTILLPLRRIILPGCVVR